MAQTKPKAGQFYGVSNNGTDGEFLQTDGAGGMAWATPITNPTITSIDYPGSATAALPAGGESVIINGTLFASGITCTVGGTSAVTAFNSATQITITTPAKAAGPYTIAVTNTDGGTASQANFIQYSGVPVWSTAAGTLGNVLEGTSASFQVTATEGSDTIEYAVTTGTLPTGLSLATATGAITGTAPAVSADTTTTFSITATDDENQTSSARSFNITVTPDLPSNHFAPYIYTGNGSTQNIPLNFSPGLTWIKSRTNPYDHNLYDIVRGADGQSGSSDKVLMTNKASAQEQGHGDVTITNSGVTVVETSVGSSGNEVNFNGANYISWNFKAGGAAVANTDGTINSDVSVNNTLGFSIVKYDGAGLSGSATTVGHGLNAAPELIIVKPYETGLNVSGWFVYSENVGNTKELYLNTNSAEVSDGNRWNSTSPSSTVFTLGSSFSSYPSYYGGDTIAYCFKSKPGFSKVGSYTGSGATGKIIQTDFKPAFVMIKRTNGTGDFNMWDNKRGDKSILWANGSNAEATNNAYQIDFLSNGFVLQITLDFANGNGSNYIYLAIAADGSTATPSLANSFETQTWTGNNAVRTIPYNFKPDLWFAKNYTATNGYGHYWTWVDSVRGGNSVIYSNATLAANNNLSGTGSDAISFVNAGVTINTSGSNGYNENAFNFAGYAFKAGGTPSINTDGTITSIVSANQAAGFSVVNWTGLGNNGQTVGHGLNTAPDLIITKVLNISGEGWYTYLAETGNTKFLTLNTTAEAKTAQQAGYSAGSNWWNDTSPTSSVFSLGTIAEIKNYNHTAYCFTSISGYSKVGSYTGTGGALTVTTGFQPGFVMIKRTDSTGNWVIVDEKRSSGDSRLYANLSNTEDAGQGESFTSTGFKPRQSSTSDTNISGGTYIYLAIKEN